MSNDTNEGTQDPKEILEDKHVVLKEDEIKESIIETYGLDEEEQADLIDKLAQDRLQEQKKLSTAIKQKITYREKLANAQKSLSEDEEEEQEEEEKPQTPVEINEDVINQRIEEKLEERELNSLTDSDEIKQEIKNLAKMKGVSVMEASKDNYIGFLRQKAAGSDRADEASASSTTKAWTGKDFSDKSPLDFDRTTKEGEAEFQEYKKFLATQG